MNIRPSQASPKDPDAQQAGTTNLPPDIKYREDVANYVTAMLAELRRIAGKAGIHKMVRALDAAYYEACTALDAEAREAAQPPRSEPAKKP